MRTRVKEWSNVSRGPRGRRIPWTARIIWYEDATGDIRLKEEDQERVQNKFFKDQVSAQKEWDAFKEKWRAS